MVQSSEGKGRKNRKKKANKRKRKRVCYNAFGYVGLRIYKCMATWRLAHDSWLTAANKELKNSKVDNVNVPLWVRVRRRLHGDEKDIDALCLLHLTLCYHHGYLKRKKKSNWLISQHPPILSLLSKLHFAHVHFVSLYHPHAVTASLHYSLFLINQENVHVIIQLL